MIPITIISLSESLFNIVNAYKNFTLRELIRLLTLINTSDLSNNMQWFKIPAKTYFEPNAIKYLRDMYGIEKAVT